MEQDKLAYLENENLRLNKLINILIEQNDALKAKIAYLENEAPSSHLYTPYLKSETGGKQLLTYLPESETGEKQLLTRSPKNVSGASELLPDHLKSEIGTKQVWTKQPENEIGKEEVLKPLPYFIPLILENIDKVQSSMGAGFCFRVKGDARQAMSKILIQAYNKQGCSYAELGKLTHRSASGMAKLIASLKKRGLVERSGKSSFRLTQLTLDNFRKVDFNLQPPDFKP